MINDFNITLAHCDSDGVLCTATYMATQKAYTKSYFTTHARLSSILNTVYEKDLQAKKMYIFDISGNKNSFEMALKFQRVIWIDHHVWEKELIREYLRPNVDLIVDSSEISCTSLAAKHFGFNDFVEIANEIDRNKVVTPEARRLRELISALRLKVTSPHYLGLELTRLSRTISVKGIKEINDSKYNNVLNNYYLWRKTAIEDSIKSLECYKEKNLKIGMILIKSQLPVHEIFEKLNTNEQAPFDILIFKTYHTKSPASPVHDQNTPTITTKLEFRTQSNFEVIKLAKFFGGGGHACAGGATVQSEVKDKELIEAINKLY